MTDWAAGPLVLPLPPGWLPSDLPMVAWGPTSGTGFRPSAVVLSEPDTRGIDEMSLMVTKDILAQEGAHLIGVDRWIAQQDEAGAGVPGRMFTYSHPLPSGDHLEMTMWLWATGSQRVQLVATVAADRVLAVTTRLHNAVTQARFVARSTSIETVRLEDLAGVADRQRYTPTGRLHPAHALKVSPDADDADWLGALDAAGALREGRPTSFGRALRESRQPGGEYVTAIARGVGGETTWRATHLRRGHLVEAGPPIWRVMAQDLGEWQGGRVEVSPVTDVQAVARLARWLGIGPTWALTFEAQPIAREAVENKIGGASTGAPRGWDRMASSLWAQGWTLVQIEVSQPVAEDGRPLRVMRYVGVGNIGFLDIVGVDAENVEIRPVRPVTLYHRLYQVFGAPLPTE